MWTFYDDLGYYYISYIKYLYNFITGYLRNTYNLNYDARFRWITT